MHQRFSADGRPNSAVRGGGTGLRRILVAQKQISRHYVVIKPLRKTALWNPILEAALLSTNLEYGEQ